MIIGVPREIKNNERRVALTPPGVTVFTNAGHDVWVEASAGIGSGFADSEYADAGAKIVDTAEEAWSAEMVMKVKEPQPEEYAFLREGLILFTYLHLAAEPELTRQLAEKKVTAIAYETIQDQKGALPLLAPMSEIAGRMSVQIGAQYLENTKGGKGVLLSGVPGVKPANVAVIGGGAVGTNAAKIAHGYGANVTILDINTNRLRELDELFSGNVNTLMSNPLNIQEAVKDADLVVGAVLIPGAKAPQLVSEDMIKEMQEGSVIIDVAVDQGGSIETVDRITTHDNPTYEKHGVLHYAVPNIPGAVARTSTMSLTNNTSQYGVFLANKGVEEAVKSNEAFAKGVNTHAGVVTHQSVAETHNMDYKPITTVLSDKTVSAH
ncbi:alanine dehydrogenase [Lentibacillus cibarius]|uniref:Alanine dehydrogenase n=1 Tax=Lentibacillus cibarius TaxID=2583219 RepID=A0A549YEY9_9BACI|nr:alanine dehydrogenase [Lentibacillus cibarius]TMN21546.1 alanine dehydrogenase [Lentibacillus cibarius]TRM10446.1 alanine dehydrogenase [Lentibacillus cibarius]